MTARGFTLVELLISITLLGIIGASGMTMWLQAQKNQALSASANQLESILLSSHNFSRDFRQEKAWGIESLDTNTYALISQNSTGEKKIEEEKTLISPVQFSEAFEVIFDAGTGKLTAPVTIVLQQSASHFATVTVNEFGSTTVDIK